ncbi:MAG: hypothetical protein U0W40_02090 [Acidimicrobiia bacterium]
MTRRHRLFPTLLTVLIAVAAALPLGASVAGAASNRACGLLTTKQVQQALGAPVSAPVAKTGSNPGCEWQTKDPKTREYLSVEIGSLGKAERARFTQLAKDPDNEVVDDLGDRAVLECAARRNGECFLLKRLWIAVGNEYLGLALVGPADTADEADALVQLGGHAVDKL